MAVPLFELYDNSHRYGPILSSLSQILGKIHFVCRESLDQKNQKIEEKSNEQKQNIQRESIDETITY